MMLVVPGEELTSGLAPSEPSLEERGEGQTTKYLLEMPIISN